LPLEQYVQQVVDALEQQFGVDALWLFGSRATGHARTDSDLDVAGLFRNSPSATDLFDARSTIETTIGIPLDLVDLERASPVLAMQVLRHGKLLIEHNRHRRIDFVSHLPGRYEDLCITRRTAEKTLLQRMRHG
jgi:predicted nucleotidyltransferase